MACSVPRRIRIQSVAGASTVLEEGGVGVFVVSGGMPGARIYFDSRTELRLNDGSIEAVDGATAFRKFSSLIVEFPAQTFDGNRVLELELYDCLTAVRPIGLERGGGAMLVHASETTLAESEILVKYDEGTLASGAELEYGIWRYRRERWIGGAAKGDQPFHVKAWHKFDVGGGSVRALIGQLVADKLDPDGGYSCSLESGWKRDFSAFGSNTQNHIQGPLLPWPREGLQIELTNPSALVTPTVQLLVYARD